MFVRVQKLREPRKNMKVGKMNQNAKNENEKFIQTFSYLKRKLT